MNWIINLTLLKKIMFVCALLMLCAISWGAFNSYFNYNLMIDATSKKNRSLVESMVSTMEGLEADAKQGLISREEA